MGPHTTTRRRVTRSRALPVLALPLTMALLAACAGGGTTGSDDDAAAPDAEAAAPAEPVDLRMTVWSANEDHLALFDEIAAEYVAANPDLVSSVTFEPLPFDEYTTAVTTQIAGGNPPDLAWILESTAPEFVESGALVALDDVLAGTEGYDVDDLNPDALTLWQSEGELFAYPFSTSPFVVFVNDDMLAAAGQPTGRELLDAGEWTWDRIQEAGAAVKDATGNDGFVIRDFEYAQWEILSTVWGAFGASAWSDDYTTCELDSPEMVEAMTFLHDSAFDAAAMPAPGTTADFFAGQAAITVTQISRASLLDDSFAWDVLPMPEGPAGQQNVIGQAGIGVFANAENPDVAADFLAFFTNPANSAKLGQYFPPPRVSLLTAEQLKATNPLLSEEQLEEVVVQGLQGAITKPAHPNFAQIQQATRAQLDSLWQADADVAAVLAATCERIQPLLEQ